MSVANERHDHLLLIHSSPRKRANYSRMGGNPNPYLNPRLGRRKRRINNHGRKIEIADSKKKECSRENRKQNTDSVKKV